MRLKGEEHTASSSHMLCTNAQDELSYIQNPPIHIPLNPRNPLPACWDKSSPFKPDSWPFLTLGGFDKELEVVLSEIINQKTRALVFLVEISGLFLIF